MLPYEYMMEEITQTNSSTKHILNTYGDPQNKIYCN